MSAGFVVLEDLDDDRRLVRVVGGDNDNMLLVVTRDDRTTARDLSWFLGGSIPHTDDPFFETPEFKAQSLLESLLSVEQLEDWRTRRRFWVPTPRGKVELGKLYNLSFQDSSGTNLIICVEPEACFELPEADIWTNLLLMLRADPEHFFDVANWRFSRGPDKQWRTGPVPRFPSRRKRRRTAPDPLQGVLF